MTTCPWKIPPSALQHRWRVSHSHDFLSDREWVVWVPTWRISFCTAPRRKWCDASSYDWCSILQRSHRVLPAGFHDHSFHFSVSFRHTGNLVQAERTAKDRFDTPFVKIPVPLINVAPTYTCSRTSSIFCNECPDVSNLSYQETISCIHFLSPTCFKESAPSWVWSADVSRRTCIEKAYHFCNVYCSI